MSIRKRLEQIESDTLRKEAALSSRSRGRKVTEICNLRTCYQQDRDKIIHTRAFRRLGHKTQVFLAPVGDHYRTRFTHTIEVSQIARSVARALLLNETLAEAISLGHDLGHTPFGHVGEQVLNEIHSGGFQHEAHSVRIVEHIEKEGKGLNLTFEVIDGIRKHSKGKGPIITDDPELKAITLEGQIVRLADIVAYINHDIDDAIRGGILSPEQIPGDLRKTIGNTSADRINRMVTDIIEESLKMDTMQIVLSSEMEKAIEAMRDFMFRQVYDNVKSNRSFDRVYNLIRELYEYFVSHPGELENEAKHSRNRESPERLACDYIAGMTDRYAVYMFKKIFVPSAWSIL